MIAPSTDMTVLSGKPLYIIVVKQNLSRSHLTFIASEIVGAMPKKSFLLINCKLFHEMDKCIENMMVAVTTDLSKIVVHFQKENISLPCEKNPVQLFEDLKSEG